ncbi:hypothetical protein GCM10009841_05760 [Microlunatus panaciterrae]
MRRARVRFGLLIVAVSLLVVLILAQQAIQNSLITSFIGAIQRQSAPILVFSTDAQRSPLGSVISTELQHSVEAVEGVADSAAIGIRSLSVAVDGQQETTATLFGYQSATLGGPDRLSAGRLPRRPTEAVGSDRDFALGQQVEVVPVGGAAPVRLTVVGLAADAQLLVTPTLFLPYAGYEQALRAVNPALTAVAPTLLAVRPAASVSDPELVTKINGTSADVEALTRAGAADGAPGVAQVRQSFKIIFALYAMVVPLVTGLFFLIITLQKASSLTLLRAIGSRSSVLVRSLLVQVLIVVGGGVLLGAALYAPLTLVSLGTLSLRFDWSAVAFWAALLVGLGLLSALVSARRVLAIDPIEATTGAGQR